MLATFAIEISFALYVLWRYKMTTITRLVVAILVCLAAFQATEYMLCGAGATAALWSSFGYTAITLLPPLGIHLALAIAGQQHRHRSLIATAYTTAAAFVAYFALYTGSISGQTCYANYVVFEGGNSIATWLYAAYYYGWLLAAVGISLLYGKDDKKPALYALALGYGAFIIPTTLVNIVDPSTIAAIPSIMCGFAVALAFVLTLKVAPETIQTRDNRQTFRQLFESRT